MSLELIGWVLLGVVVWWVGAWMTAAMMGWFSPEQPELNGYCAMLWPVTWVAIALLVAIWSLCERIPPVRWLSGYFAGISSRVHAEQLLRRAKLK